MKQNVCEPKRLSAYLEGSLSSQKESDLFQHLEHCPDCVKKLEQFAADSSQWQAAQDFLSARKDQRHVLPVAGKRQNDIESDQHPHALSLSFSARQVLNMLDASDDPRFIGRICGYEISGVIGSGAMGVVMKAFDKTLDRVVALKVMNPTLAACGTARHRFAREAKAAAGVLHPNVIAIHSVSTNQDLPFLVMPYVTGTSLQQRISKQGPLELGEVLRIGNQIAAGLAAAHQQGLIHRDIKPSNIMLDEGVETAVITDFGLARTIDDATMTRSGTITGTPEYMSPEQARGESVDCSSDVFSLASVLYTLCTGSRPFPAKTSFGVLRKIIDQDPKPIRQLNPEVPSWLCNLIQKMHSKSPADRPSSVQVRDLLESCLAHVYGPDRIPLPKELSTLPTFGKKNSFQPLLFGAIMTMSIFVVAMIAFAMQSSGDLPSAENGSVSVAGKSSKAAEPVVHKTHKLKFPNKDEVGNLVIDINRGSIEVASHDRDDVWIEILTPPSFKKSAGSDGSITNVFVPKYDLDFNKKTNQIKLDSYNQNFVLNLRITIPKSTNLNLDTYMDGDISVKNVTGTVKATSQHSDISLMGVKSSVTGYSRNGNLTVGYTEVLAGTKLDLESYNGDVTLSRPKSIGATTAVSAGRGSYALGFESKTLKTEKNLVSRFPKIKAKHQKYQFRKINGGEVPIRIESEHGKIQIRKTKK